MSSFNPKAYLEPATKALEKQFSIVQSRMPKAALVLGTGWGDLLEIAQERSMPMRDLPGFESLGEIQGHKRLVCYGQVAGKTVIVLRGRVHQYEGMHDPLVEQMVRLQVEMLVELGVKTFVLTNAAGALGGRASVGQVVAIDGFLSMFAPPPPLTRDEFWCADDVLDPDLIRLAQLGGPHTDKLAVLKGCYAMVRGPNFEGRAYDKAVLREHRATCVGMSTFPEASVLAGHRKSGVRVLALSYITNDDKQEHSHEDNQAQAKRHAPALRVFLEHLIKLLP